jgi:hypothetical protein
MTQRDTLVDFVPDVEDRTVTLPDLHRQFLETTLPRIEQDARIVGVAAAGSLANGRPDVHSDVDLVLAVEDDRFDEVSGERIALVSSWAPLVAGFTGEHVGEPRVIISLVGPPLLHVDFKFVQVSDVATRIDRLSVLWERDGRLTAALAERPPTPSGSRTASGSGCTTAPPRSLGTSCTR